MPSVSLEILLSTGSIIICFKKMLQSFHFTPRYQKGDLATKLTHNISSGLSQSDSNYICISNNSFT